MEMVEDVMRYHIEKTYETLREKCKELSGDAWQNHSLWFPTVSELRVRKNGVMDMLALNQELSDIVKNMSSQTIRGQGQTISALSSELQLQQNTIAQLANTNAEKDSKIDKQKASINKLYIDSLTGLSKRERFVELLIQESVVSLHKTNYTTINLDLNGLKYINDNHGYKAGDKYLSLLGKAISSSISEHDWAFRIHGDEFTVVPKITPEQAESIARNAGEKITANATDSTRMLRAADIIAKRVLDKFQALWQNEHGITASFGYGVATINEPEVLGKIAKKQAEIEYTEKRQISVSELVDEIHEVADKRQKQHKARLKNTGEYGKMTCIGPDFVDDRLIVNKQPKAKKK